MWTQFSDRGSNGLPANSPTVSIEQVEDVIVTTLEPTPEGATHWSRRKMAEKTGLSASTTGRILPTIELNPSESRRAA